MENMNALFQSIIYFKSLLFTLKIEKPVDVNYFPRAQYLFWIGENVPTIELKMCKNQNKLLKSQDIPFLTA